MGQTIQMESVTVGEIALFDTDRTMTGQDGVGFSPGMVAGGTPGSLAGRLFEADSAIDHVFVLSNQVTVRRRGGWDDESLKAATSVVRDFFVHYEGNRGAPVSEV